jgi:hypothetical protein
MPQITDLQIMTPGEHTLYLHRFEYRTLDKNGKWSEPEIRYHNATYSEKTAEYRHQTCTDGEYDYNGYKSEGIYGYSWKNCKLVKRTINITVEEEELES